MKPGSVAVGFLDDGHWSACFGLSYRDTLVNDLLGPHRILKELRNFTGTGGIVAGRNRVAQSFLDQTEAEWLWMVDTDMGWDVDALERLLQTADPQAAPVVGGLAFALKRNGRGPGHSQRFVMTPTVFAYRDLAGSQEVGFAPIQDYPRDQVMDCAGTGAAFLLVHRGALEKIRAQFGDVWFDPITHPTGERGKPRTFSEDLSFCIRLGLVDVPLKVDTSVKTVHHKGELYLSEALYDQQRAIDALTGKPRISLLCPTRGRVESLMRLMSSALETAHGPVEFVFYVDDDDEDTQRFLDDVSHLPARYIKGPRIVLSQMWNRCAEKATADVMMHCGDDIVFQTGGWDSRVLEVFEKIPDRIAFVYGNDLIWGHELGTHGFLHRRWVETLGRLVPPYFSSDFNDTWLNEVADAVGRRFYLEDVITEHMHPAVGKADLDQTHEDRLARDERDDNRARYEALADEREADAAKLRAVMS